MCDVIFHEHIFPFGDEISSAAMPASIEDDPLTFYDPSLENLTVQQEMVRDILNGSSQANITDRWSKSQSTEVPPLVTEVLGRGHRKNALLHTYMVIFATQFNQHTTSCRSLAKQLP